MTPPCAESALELVVDRVEGAVAVVELPGVVFVDFPLAALPPSAGEGDRVWLCLLADASPAREAPSGVTDGRSIQPQPRKTHVH
jgi:hypothetical protein